MRAWRMSLAAMVTLALFGGLGGVVVAQDEAPAMWLTATGTEEPCTFGEAEEHIEDGPVSGTVAMPLTCPEDLGDPRLAGTSTKVWNSDCYEGAGCIYWGTQELTGADGTWVGTFNGTIDPDGSATGYTAYMGADGYEGLAFVGHAIGLLGEPATIFGRVYEGDPPPPSASR